MHLYIYYKILNNNTYIYLIGLLIWNVYFYYTMCTILYIDEYTNYSIPTREYIPYNPNLVNTSQGYRVEIDGNMINGLNGNSARYNVANSTFSNESYMIGEITNSYHSPLIGERTHVVNHSSNYVSHPSHYPPQNDLMVSSLSSNHVTWEDIEPTRSQINNEGYHYPSQDKQSRNPEDIKPNVGIFQNIKNKVSDFNRKIDNDLKENYIKRKEFMREQDKIRATRSKSKKLLSQERYVSDIDIGFTRAENRELYNRGFIIKNKKLVRKYT